MGPTSDRTAVTGAATLATPRQGEVIGARYEIRHRLRADPFSLGFLAFDQETEESVLLRLVRPELLDLSLAGKVRRQLQLVVGIGGKYLTEIRDADRDRHWVYTTEDLPDGVSLQEVLDGRLGSGTRTTAQELLPLVAHLDAALAVVPQELRHGDVRSAQIWLDANRLELKGPFFVPALPDDVVAGVLQRHGDLRRRVAPELMSGGGSSASDRYAVAAIAHEALTLQPPPEPGAAVSAALGTLARPLGALLHPNPAQRPASLEPLIEALARVAGLEAPDLEPAPFRRRQPLRPSRAEPRTLAPASPRADTMDAMGSSSDPNAPDSVPTVVGPDPSTNAPTVVVGASSAMDEATAVRQPPSPTDVRESDSTTVGPPPNAVGPSGSPGPNPSSDQLATAKMAALSTEEAETLLARATEPVAPEQTEDAPPTATQNNSSETRVPSDPAIPAQASKESSLDPRLVRMAQAADKARPRPRRFPSDPGLPAEEGDEESSLDPRLVRAALGLTLEESEPEVPLDPAVATSPKKDGTQELAMDELDFVDTDDDVPLDPAVPVQARPDGTQELHLDDLAPIEEAPPRETHGTDRISLEDLEQMAAEHRRAAVPGGVKPVPRPRRDSGLGLAPAAPLFDDSSAPKAVASPSQPPSVMVPVVTQAASPRRPTTPSRPSSSNRRKVGLKVVALAMLIGLGIILGSFLYARHKQAQADEARRQRLQERFQQLRGESRPQPSSRSQPVD